MIQSSIRWSNYSDFTRPHPKWWLSKGNPVISGKSGLVKYYNLARIRYKSFRYDVFLSLGNPFPAERFQVVGQRTRPRRLILRRCVSWSRRALRPVVGGMPVNVGVVLTQWIILVIGGR